MATDKSQPTDSTKFSLLGLGAFLIVVALFVFVNTKVGTRAVGLGMVAGALIQQWQGRISYGWESRPPSGHITGWLATVLNLLFGALGVAVVIWPGVAMGILGWDRG